MPGLPAARRVAGTGRRREAGRVRRARRTGAGRCPGFGDPAAQIVVVGLAPAAHGANRTGRVFTGDRSGDWLFRALHRAGLANQAQSVSVDDGLAVVGRVDQCRRALRPAGQQADPDRARRLRSVPRPGARPPPSRESSCASVGSPSPRVCRHYAVRPRPTIRSRVAVEVPGGPTLLCSYHPSQQNTFTGKLTEPMLDDVMRRRRRTREPPVGRRTYRRCMAFRPYLIEEITRDCVAGALTRQRGDSPPRIARGHRRGCCGNGCCGTGACHGVQRVHRPTDRHRQWLDSSARGSRGDHLPRDRGRPDRRVSPAPKRPRAPCS